MKINEILSAELVSEIRKGNRLADIDESLDLNCLQLEELMKMFRATESAEGTNNALFELIGHAYYLGLSNLEQTAG